VHKILKKSKYWRKLIMKTAMRMIVLMLMLGVSGFAQSSSLSLPGPVPDFPPQTAA
jgi:hypothetical protein